MSIPILWTTLTFIYVLRSSRVHSKTVYFSKIALAIFVSCISIFFLEPTCTFSKTPAEILIGVISSLYINMWGNINFIILMLQINKEGCISAFSEIFSTLRSFLSYCGEIQPSFYLFLTMWFWCDPDVLFPIFMAPLVTYGSFQARDWNWATAVNAGSFLGGWGAF